jgi:hypothetical protein
MAQITGCPQCGETDELTGRATDHGIEVVCGRCQAAWLRGTPRCRACGGAESVTRRQVMARHPRGNQLAIIGRREVMLCPRCDAEVLGRDPQAIVPEDYVSRFLFGTPTPTPQRPMAEPAEPTPHDAAAPHSTTPSAPGATTHSAAPSPKPAAAAPTATAAPQRVPTVREAIAAFLAEQPHSNSLAMVMLGQHLGPARRLDDLGSGAVEQLAAWIDDTWGAQPEAQQGDIRAAVDAAIAFWRRQGWLPEAAPEDC